MPTLQILYHGHCFDGASSAAIFTRFHREAFGPFEVTYRGMAHALGDPFGADHDATFWADENACVDFRYSPSPRLTWWCDHHGSAFMTEAHRRTFEARASPRQHFDPTAPSCAGLLARWLAREHGFDAEPVADLVRWADLVDAAAFRDPAQPVRLEEPALKLMALFEAQPDWGLERAIIEALDRGGVAAALALDGVRAALGPVLADNRAQIALFRRRIAHEGGVAFADLTETRRDGFNKFIPYDLDPETRYTVVVTASPRRAKVSVGSNPWRRPTPLVDIGALCARYGGGGHAAVGAVTLPPGQAARAREIAREIAAILRGDAPVP